MGVQTGADIVIGHHAHILKGVEMYKGKAIFYGLGNFAMEHHLRPPGTRKEMSKDFRNRNKHYGIKIEPGWEKYPFLPEARNTMLVKAHIEDGAIRKVTYIPTLIDQSPRPEYIKRSDPRAQQVADYIESISRSQDLNVNFAWEGDEVAVLP